MLVIKPCNLISANLYANKCCISDENSLFLRLNRSNGDEWYQPRCSKYFVDENGRFPCEKCGKSYKQKTHLIRHLHFECGVEPKFACRCGRKFKQRSNYNTHIKMMHHF
ncbi:unnamed protein product [Phyllotreta striolata]|uniref:C2H2-type domain-containing protein n=1 Tax=Phyllotreta striolata TaxID=444603 RepID=A0A9N9TYV9_PHYSR|nr:unnamed protein product [Phyllotreta striolata]